MYRSFGKKLSSTQYSRNHCGQVRFSDNLSLPDYLVRQLEQNKISCRDDCLKTELAEIIKKIAPEPLYKIDEIAKSFGHEVLRIPPYHPELQPIENCWGVVKNHIARNCDLTMANLVKQLDNGFEKVTAETCSKIITKFVKLKMNFGLMIYNLIRKKCFKVVSIHLLWTIATCMELGREPDRPFKGSFKVRIHPELHERVAIAAVQLV